MTDRARALGLTAARVTVERVTAEESARAQSRAAGALAQRGIERGGRVAFLCPSSAGLIAALLGALRAGIVPVCLNPSLLEHERRLLLDDADPDLVVEPRELASLLEGPEADLAPVPLARPMHYTSGTTGRPKGAWSCGRAVPGAAEGGGARRLPLRHGVGVLRLDRGSVHGLFARRMAGSAGHGGTRPAATHGVGRRRHDLV